MSEPIRFVFVEWWDSRAIDRWASIEEISLEPAVCRSVGWVVAENVKHMALAGTWSPTNDEYTSIITIPRACIRKEIELKWPEKTKGKP